MTSIYCSIVCYTKEASDYYPVKFVDTLSLLRLKRFMTYNPQLWVRLHSTWNDLHIPIYDFDERVDVWDIAKQAGVSGHIYKTAKGYHFFGDQPMQFNDIYYLGYWMGVDPKYLECSKQRGFFAIRCGRKQDRPYDDIVYVGHTSGEDVEKGLFLKVHDAICRRLSKLYNNTHPLRSGWIPIANELDYDMPF